MPGVHLVSTDPNDVESGLWLGGNPQPLDSATGSATFGAVLVTSGTWTFTASDTGGTGTSYISDTSTNVVVVAGAPTKLCDAILPNQALYPGTVSGVNGAAATQAAGSHLLRHHLCDRILFRTRCRRAAIRSPSTRAISTMWIRATFNLVDSSVRHHRHYQSLYRPACVSLTVTDNDNYSPGAHGVRFDPHGDRGRRFANPARASRAKTLCPEISRLPRGVTGTPNTQLAVQISTSPPTSRTVSGTWSPAATADGQDPFRRTRTTRRRAPGAPMAKIP